jgi:HTH-type transcriptional regulator/antitoxin HipB
MQRTLQSPRHERLRALLVQARLDAGLTQTEVAKRLGRYQSFVATVESGQRRVDVIEFLAIAEAIGFDPSKVIAELGKVKSPR